jgi:hypothetical protein
MVEEVAVAHLTIATFVVADEVHFQDLGVFLVGVAGVVEILRCEGRVLGGLAQNLHIFGKLSTQLTILGEGCER